MFKLECNGEEKEVSIFQIGLQNPGKERGSALFISEDRELGSKQAFQCWIYA
jgi:hypothetical protein